MKKFFILLLKPLSFIPALCMMYLIFSFSGQSGEQSGALSQKISREIVVVADKALDKNLDETRIQYYTDKLEFPDSKSCPHDRILYSCALCFASALCLWCPWNLVDSACRTYQCRFRLHRRISSILRGWKRSFQA